MRSGIPCPPGWVSTRLIDAFDIDLGKMLNPTAASGGDLKPYLANRNVQWNRFELDDISYMDFSASERKHFRLRKGDLLVCEGGEIGRTAIWNEELPECYFQKAIHRLRPREQPVIEPRFMLHYMKHAIERNLFQGLIGQTSIAHLTRERLAAFHATHPASLAEQRKIAEILDSADDAIHHSEAAAGKLRLRASGLAHDLLGRMDSPARPLSTYLEMKPRNGFSPNEVDVWTGTVALGLGCLTPDGFVPSQIKPIPAGDPRYTAAWLTDGDLLISRSNTFDLVGLVGRYRNVGAPCVYPDLMMRLVPNGLVRPAFLELALRDVTARQQIRRMSQGTSGSMVKISAGGVMRLMVKVPDLQEQDRLLSIYEADTATLCTEDREIAKLQLLKQGLMDDLLTGQVRVPVQQSGSIQPERSSGPVLRGEAGTRPADVFSPESAAR